jgi:hypothetical protein
MRTDEQPPAPPPTDGGIALATRYAAQPPLDVVHGQALHPELGRAATLPGIF